MVNYVAKNKLPVNIDVLRPATFAALGEKLENAPGFYHIVHFDGHGVYREDGGYLCFENAENPSGELISADVFADMMGEHKVSHVILNACRSAKADIDENGASHSIAASLIRAGVSEVLAMRYNLKLDSAKKFIPAFYEQLIASGDLHNSVNYAQQIMRSQNATKNLQEEMIFQDWMVPVLFSGSQPHKLPRFAPTPEFRKNILPDNTKRNDFEIFVGRDQEVFELEQAIQRKRAGILLHGMAGEGKTTLIRNFLQWLKSTNSRFEKYVWIDFEIAKSSEEIIDIMTIELVKFKFDVSHHIKY